jgi:hypothetical protein
MRNIILGLGGLLPILATGQCGANYIYHPFGTCTEGRVDFFCSVPTDSVVWSTGGTMHELNSSPLLPPGTYTWQAYHNGEVIQTGEVEIEQLEWHIAPPSLNWTGGGAMISVGEVMVPYCTSEWQTPCCVPVDSLTYMHLVQDGTTEMVTESCFGCEQYYWGNGPCGYSGATWFSNVPTGHSYTVRLYDLACGNIVDDTTVIIAHGCDNLELMHEEVGTLPDVPLGEIHLLEAVPDPSEPYPLQAPVIGTAKLYRGPDGFDQVGDAFENVASASWTELEAGDYRLEFTPEAGCNRVLRPVHVATTTSIGPGVHVGALLQVVPTADPGRITIRTAQGIVTNAQVLDAMGRMVPIHKLADGSYHMGTPPPGTYLVRALVGGSMATTRFVVP